MGEAAEAIRAQEHDRTLKTSPINSEWTKNLPTNLCGTKSVLIESSLFNTVPKHVT